MFLIYIVMVAFRMALSIFGFFKTCVQVLFLTAITDIHETRASEVPPFNNTCYVFNTV